MIIRGEPKASGLVLVRSPSLTSLKWRELVSSGRLVCRCHDVIFPWCHVCLVSFSTYAFIEAAALCSIVFRYYAGAQTATQQSSGVCVSFFYFVLFLWRCRFFRVFLYHYYRFLLVMESTS